MYSQGRSSKKGSDHLAAFGWYGKILWVSSGVENIKLVENMNCYEFARALSFKMAENEI